MAVILFLGAPIFIAVIFLAATFYYRSKVIRCQERLQRMWVESMLSSNRKDNQFKPLRTAEEDTYSLKST
jgi:hypothetical protein